MPYRYNTRANSHLRPPSPSSDNDVYWTGSSEDDLYLAIYRNNLAASDDSSLDSDLEEQHNIANNTFTDSIESAEVKEQELNFELFKLLDYTTMNIDFKLVFGDIKCIDHLNAKQVITMACTICLQEYHVGALGQHWANQATGKAYTTADISLLYTQATIHEDDPDLDR